MKKILIIIEDYTRFGGVEKVTANMLSIFMDNNFPIWGILSLNKENDTCAIRYDKNVNIEVVKKQDVANFVQLNGITDVILQIGSLKEANYIVNRLYGKVDIIPVLHNTPYVYTKYFLDKSTWKDWLRFCRKEFLVKPIHILFFKNIIKKSKLFLTVSQKGMEELKDILKRTYHNLDYVYNFIPNEIDETFHRKENIILYGGRLSKDKRVFETVKYLSPLLKKNSSWKYYILGDGEEYGKIQDYIEKNDIKNISLVGFTSNVKEYLSESKVCLLYSLYEGLPTILIEAGICRNVLVSYNSKGGASDIVINYRNGFIVNDEKELVEKIELLINNEALLNEMAMNDHINKSFECSRILDKWRKILGL